MRLTHVCILLLSGLIGDSWAECERNEECEFEKLKRNIVIFAGAALGFALVLMLCIYVVQRLRKTETTEITTSQGPLTDSSNQD